MLLENFWPFRKLELRGSSVKLQDEELVGEVLTPEVDNDPAFPRKEKPRRGASPAREPEPG